MIRSALTAALAAALGAAAFTTVDMRVQDYALRPVEMLSLALIGVAAFLIVLVAHALFASRSHPSREVAGQNNGLMQESTALLRGSISLSKLKRARETGDWSQIHPKDVARERLLLDGALAEFERTRDSTAFAGSIVEPARPYRAD